MGNKATVCDRDKAEGGTLCSWQDCLSQGLFPAPKSPVDINDRYYFCLAHIRLYNNSWDFFRKMGMDAGQIDGFQKDKLTGHRPTWKFGVGGINSATIEELEKQVFGEFRGTHHQTNSNSEIRLPKPAHDALKILGLKPPLTLREIKKKYKHLAKEYHPDLNGGANLDRIKQINEAYSYLKKFFKE